MGTRDRRPCVSAVRPSRAIIRFGLASHKQAGSEAANLIRDSSHDGVVPIPPARVGSWARLISVLGRVRAAIPCQWHIDRHRSRVYRPGTGAAIGSVLDWLSS
jgi:hypothetical protein